MKTDLGQIYSRRPLAHHSSITWPWQPCEIIKRKRIGLKQCLQHSGYTPCYSWTQTFLVQGIFNLFFFFFSLLQWIFLEWMDSLFWQEMGSLPCQLTAVFKVSFSLSKEKSSRADICVLLQRTHKLWGNESYAKQTCKPWRCTAFSLWWQNVGIFYADQFHPLHNRQS